MITLNLEPSTADAGPDQTGAATCGLTTVTLAGNTPAIGTGLWTIVSGTGGTITTPASPTSTFTGIAGNAYQLRWTISNAPCAPSSDDVLITFNLEPSTADAGPDQTGSTTCGLTSVTLAGNSPTVGTGLWSIVSGTGGIITTPASPTSTFTGIAGNAYQLRWTISNAPCAPSSDDVLIKFNIKPTNAVAGADQTGAETCGLTTVTLAATPTSIGSGIWSIVSGTGGVIATPGNPASTFSGNPGATYVLRWSTTNAVCVSSSSTITITLNQNPSTADAGPDQTLDYLFSTYMNAVTPVIGTGSWNSPDGTAVIVDPGDPYSEVTNLTTGFNRFVWRVSNGICPESSDEVIVEVKDLLPPTVITPNEDGLNDALLFPGLDAFPESELRIFNRWGSEVFFSNDYRNDWKGKDMKNRDLQVDTYFYILRISNGRVINGFIEIRR